MSTTINADIIHLQNSHVTQYNNTSGKTLWKVRKNITSEELATLPADLTEAQVFDIMEFARTFELEAFNKGIEKGKSDYKDVYDQHILQLQNNMTLARSENERLASKLEKFIMSDE